MQRVTYTDEQRNEALTLVAELGQAEAARRTGIPFGTIASWGHRAGVSAPDPSSMKAALEHKANTIAERKGALAVKMLDHAERMLGQLTAPITEKVVKTVAVGVGRSETEVVTVKYDQPPTGDQKRIVEAVGILVEKIQLLTGEATARIEQTGTEPAQRSHLVSVVDQLAARRVA